MEFGILGPLQVFGADGQRIALPTGRQRDVLLRLLVAFPDPVRADRLAGDLTGDQTHHGASTVRSWVARLRSGLGAQVVATRDGGYALDVADDRIDAHRCERLVAHARRDAVENPERASELVDRAVALWRGDPLSDVADCAWASAMVSRLTELHVRAHETRAEIALRQGRHRDVLPDLADLTDAHPLREDLWAHRMVALYRSGRQAGALACFRRVSQALHSDLGIGPGPQLRAIHKAVVTQDPALYDTVPRPEGTPAPGLRTSAGPRVRPGDGRTPEPPTNIAAARGRLFGRDDDLARLTATLAHERIVTMTGVGGVGKSRLATEAASVVRTSHPDGVWCLDLAPVSDDASLDRVLADLIGVPRRADPRIREVVADHLASRRMLVLLDNGEHVLGAVANLVGDLVGRCPGLTFLVTSREALGVPQEQVWSVPPLRVSPPEAGLDELLANDAVALFASRAEAVSPGFAVDAGNARVVARICRRLDGIPLAIELAAARMRMLTPQDLDERLDQRFRLLTGGRHAVGRHRTLRNAIDWSYDLLERDEQVALCRLSVFGGAFDLEGAAALLAHDEGERFAIEMVGRLIDRSLLVVDRDVDGIRYHMLETIRQYGLDRLDDAGRLVEVRHAHADHVHAIVERAGRLLRGPEERAGHALLRRMHDEIAAAVQWFLASGRSRDAAQVIRWIRWDRVDRRLALDTMRWARLLTVDPDLDDGDAAFTRAMAAMGWWLEGAGDRAVELAHDAISRSRSLPMATKVEAAVPAAWVLWEAGATDEATSEVPGISDPDDYGIVEPDLAAVTLAGMVIAIADLGLSADQLVHARRLADAAVGLAEQSGSPTVRAMSLQARGVCNLDGDPDAAERDMRAAADLQDVAWPVWSLHARAHLLRRDALAGRTDGRLAELADVLRSALDHANDLHLRPIAGYAGAAVMIAGPDDLATIFAPLVRSTHASTTPGSWQAPIRELAMAHDGAPPRLGTADDASIGDVVSALLVAVRHHLANEDSRPDVS